MSKKRLSIEGIANELEGASLFFQKPAPTTSLHALSVNPGDTVPSKRVERKQASPTARSIYEVKNERPNVPTNEPSNVQKPKRVKVRHTFDIFQDQLFALQSIQLEAVQNGRRKPKLGDMVQRAIDLYLEKRGDKTRRGKA